ncbi:MAG: phosphatase PAP2 family protein, partial [Gaiellales bacterium]
GTTGRLMWLAVNVFRERWWWKRLVLAIVGFMSFAFTYLAYRNLKSFVSLIDYRSYDQELLSLDRWMSFGHDPATVLHNTLGTDFAAHVLSWIYLIYIPLVAITVSAALAFIDRMREAFVYVATFMWCWILGTASYYAIPTLGPFATRSRLFEKLEYTNVTRLQGSLMQHRFTLHADNIGDEVVGGIAGFASLHVGIVVAVIVLMRYYRQRVLMWMAIAFLIPTILATIYFGWHFIVDDIAGIFLGWFAFVLGRATVYPRILMVWRRRVTHEPARGSTNA